MLFLLILAVFVMVVLMFTSSALHNASSMINDYTNSLEKKVAAKLNADGAVVAAAHANDPSVLALVNELKDIKFATVDTDKIAMLSLLADIENAKR